MLRNLGSRLRTIFLLSKVEKSSPDYLDMYAQDYGAYGLGLNKDMLVVKGLDNHIIGHNKALVENVRDKFFNSFLLSFKSCFRSRSAG